jgi:hypothetical protein
MVIIITIHRNYFVVGYWVATNCMGYKAATIMVHSVLKRSNSINY